jgi:anti-sigma factor ChrR (cupin superfamily)
MRTMSDQSRWLTLLLVVAAGATSTAAPQRGTAMNTPAAAVKWEPYAPGNPLQVARVWGDRAKPGDYAILLKMPAGFEAGRHSHTNDYHGVTVQGIWVHTNDGGKPQELPPGSVVLQPGKQVHNDACKGTAECIILIHQQGPGDFLPAK